MTKASKSHRSRRFHLGLCLPFFLPLAHAATVFPQPSWQAVLSADFHDVSGTITVLNSSSIQIDQFTYDGQGLSVYFYLGAAEDSTSFTNGLQIGPQLFGTVFNGSEGPMVIDLPTGTTLEGYGAISVWCKDVNASFGSGTFAPVPEPSSPLLIGMAVGITSIFHRRRSHETI